MNFSDTALRFRIIIGAVFVVYMLLICLVNRKLPPWRYSWLFFFICVYLGILVFVQDKSYIYDPTKDPITIGTRASAKFYLQWAYSVFMAYCLLFVLPMTKTRHKIQFLPFLIFWALIGLVFMIFLIPKIGWCIPPAAKQSFVLLKATLCLKVILRAPQLLIVLMAVVMSKISKATVTRLHYPISRSQKSLQKAHMLLKIFIMVSYVLEKIICVISIRTVFLFLKPIRHLQNVLAQDRAEPHSTILLWMSFKTARHQLVNLKLSIFTRFLRCICLFHVLILAKSRGLYA